METQFTKWWGKTGYTMDSKHINCGYSIRHVINDLPQKQDDVDKFDCSLVVTMLNGKEQEGLRFTEHSAAGADLRELCGLLRRHKRHVLIIGGAADLWEMKDLGLDSTVKNMILIAQCEGIPCITGEHDFRSSSALRVVTIARKFRIATKSSLRCLKKYAASPKI